MNTTQLINQVMKENNCNELEAISALQTAAATTGDDSLMDELCEIKSAIIAEMF